jgi:polysaccharide export outer membrane protein
MSTSYKHKAGLVSIAFTLLTGPIFGQSLEDKVSQARKLQAQALLSTDPSLADSLMNEKNVHSRLEGLGRAKKQPVDFGAGPSPDSLLYGPPNQDSLAMENDTAAMADSTLPSKRAKPKRAALPQRYEQRVFRSVDRSLFANGSGGAGREYILGAGDAVSVALWGDKEKEYSLVLNADGKVFMEGAGSVLLAGNNLDAAQNLLRQRLAKIYSGISRGTTHVELSLGKSGPVRVFVLGEVKVPGGYVFSGQTSILTALYYAKGPTDIGTVRNLQLTRGGTKYALDLYKYLLRGESMSPHSLQDNDVLFAGRAAALVEIKGDVGRPAVYELKKGEGVKELIEFAGGLNPTAAAHRITLQRVFEDGKRDYQELSSPQDFLSGKAKLELQDGDRILIEKSTEISHNFLTITGPVKYPGTYEASDVLTVDQLVEKAGGLREDAFLGRVHVLRFNPDGSSSLMAYSLAKNSMDSVRLQPRDEVILYSLKEMYQPDSVQIAGAVFKPGKYEFREGIGAKDLIMQAGGMLPHHEAGRILVFRSSGRERKVEQIDLNVVEGLAKSEPVFPLMPNDLVQIPIDPKWYQKEVVVLDGLFLHPGKYALLYPGEPVSSVITRAGGFKEDAYVEGGRFFRTKDSVGRVGVDLRQALQKTKSKSNLPMEGGDSIFVPSRLNTVKVIGEVGFETSVLFKEGSSVQYYVEKAGGYTRRSERDRVVVQYANGETSRDGYFNRKPDAGSVIYVPQGPEPKPVDWFAGVNMILGTAGVITAIILSIQAIQNN